jgi:hypothetical protein
MNIRTKRIQDSVLSAKQQQNQEKLFAIITELEKKAEFKTKIGAELVITKKTESNPENAKLFLSAFDPRTLSQFVAQVMIEAIKINLTCRFSMKSTEAFNEPVWTNEIAL